MAGEGVPDREYADYLMRLYGGGQDEDVGSELSHSTTTCTSVETAPERRPQPRPLSNAERLSRNRAAKRAATDVTLYNHLSTMYHMNRRIYEMYRSAGLLQPADSAPSCPRGVSRSSSQCSGHAAPSQHHPPATYGVPPPSIAGTSRAMPPPGLTRQGPQSRPGTAPRRSAASAAPALDRPHSSGVAVRVHHVAPQVAAAGGPESAPQPPSFVKRRVQNTAAALKTAILDEICSHRIYEGSRLRALFRSYLSLNAGEAFYPTLARVIQELGTELGVA